MQYVKLVDLRQMLKAECRDSLSVGTAIDNELNVLLKTKQELLASQADWAQLEVVLDVPITAGNPYADFPAINTQRPFVVETLLSELYNPVEFGITSEQYNFPQSTTPIRRWKYKAKTDATAAAQFEVWPTPPLSTVVRFTGQQQLLPFVTNDDVCTLDGLMLVLYVAADRLLALEKKDWQSKLNQANAIAATLKSTSSLSKPIFRTYESDECCATRSRVRPILVA